MTGNAHKNGGFMHNYTPNVQIAITFSSKSLRKWKKMCYFAPRKRQNAENFQDSKFIINILKIKNYVRNWKQSKGNYCW